MLPPVKTTQSTDVVQQVLDVCNPVSLNLTRLPNGLYRATAMTTDSKSWPRHTGITINEALVKLLKDLQK